MGQSREHNPFRVIEDEGHRMRAGSAFRERADQVRWGADAVETMVFAAHPDEGGDGVQVLYLDWLWEPLIGSVIELGEPNRDAVVVGHRYMLSGGKITSVVFVTDSMIDLDTRPRTRARDTPPL